MQVSRIETTDAFCVVDLEGAPISIGVARLAPKVLLDGAELLARATTYALATFNVRAGGASAGINTKPDARGEAIAAFVEALAPRVAAGELHLSPGTGLSPDDLAALGCTPLDEALAAQGAVAAASAFGSGRAAVAGNAAAEWDARLSPSWAGGGADDAWLGVVEPTADVDVLFLAGKSGLLDHEAAAGVRARVVVAATPVPVTAKAYATLNRAGATFVPDAVSCAAPLLALADPAGEEPVGRVARLAAELAAEGGEPWRLAVARAESFLATWQDQLPYGRPLA